MALCKNGIDTVQFEDERINNLYSISVGELASDESTEKALKTVIQRARSVNAHRYAPYIAENLTASEHLEAVESIRFMVHRGIKSYLENNPDADSVSASMLYDNIIGNFQRRQKKLFKADREEEAEMLGRVIQSFPTLWTETRAWLRDKGVAMSGGRIHVASGHQHDRQIWEDMGRFLQSDKATASANIKMAMSFVPRIEFEYNADGSIKRGPDGSPSTIRQKNILGMPSFYRMTEVWNLTLNVLSDQFPRTFEHYVQILREKGQYNPALLKVAEKVSTFDDQLQQEFVNAMGKHYANFQLVLARELKGDSYRLTPIASDRFSKQEAMMNEWRDNLQTEGGITYYDQYGNVRIDQEQVQEIKENLENAAQRYESNSPEYAKALNKALDSIGLSVPMEYIRASQQGATYLPDGFASEFWQLDQQSFRSGSIIGRIFDSLLQTPTDEDGNAIEGDPFPRDVDPTTSPVSAAAVRQMASGAIEMRTDLWAPSFTNVANKRLYSIQDHEPLTVKFNRLKDQQQLRDLLLDPFAEHSQLGRVLAGVSQRADIRNVTPQEQGDAQKGQQKSLLNDIQFAYVDGMTIQGNRKGQTVDQLSERDQLIQRIGFFQNSGNDTRFFQGPTLSDKQRSYLVKMPSYQSFGEMDSTFWNGIRITKEEGDIQIELTKGAIKFREALYNAALSEINRIIHTQNWVWANGASRHPLGADYTHAARQFLLFEELRYENIEDTDLRDTIWQDENRLNDPKVNSEAEQAIKEILAEHTIQKAQEMNQRWNQMGLSSFMNRSYIDNKTPFRWGDDRAQAYAALDMVTNYRIFYTDAFRLLHSDPAQSFNWDTERSDDLNIRATLGNFQKRLAMDMAPSISSNFGEKDVFTKATIQDRFVSSDLIDQYREIFKDTVGTKMADSYRGIESTDAQEMTTLKEHLRVMRAHGQIDQQKYDDLIQRIDNSEGDYHLTDQELQTILFQPHKPVYVGQRWDANAGMMMQVYTKSSSFPLLPQITEGTPLDDLRMIMEGRVEGVRGIDRVAYQSADKLGGIFPARIFDSTGNMLDQKEVANNLQRSTQVLTRDGFGLQFLVPDKADQVTMQTQFNKLFLTDVLGTSGFSFEGESMTGRELYQKKEEIRIEMMDLLRQRLFDRLGVDPDETGYSINPEKLREVLLDEADERGWSPVAKEEIRSIVQEDIDVPLSFTGASNQIENLLLSLIDKGIITMKMHGRGYVQASSAGIQWETASQSGKIAFHPDYDPSTGLQHTRLIGEGENQTVQRAQIVVPWHFRDENGDLIPMEDYVDNQDGKRILDMDRIDQELLHGVGFRTPYQGRNSGMPFEIVGFMPPSMGLLAFVPDEIVVQMGSDFDVDKLWSYLRQYHIEDGSIARINDQANRLNILKDQYMSVMEASLMNPDHNALATNLQPLDRADLKNEIENLRHDIQVPSALDVDQQAGDYVRQNVGKSLIGITSLWSQLQSILQHSEVRLEPKGKVNPIKPIRVKTREKGPDVQLEVAGGDAYISSLTSGRISLQDAIMLFQNAAVDNAKENILGPLGISLTNAHIAMYMLVMNDGRRGVDLEHVTRLLNQPIIKEVMQKAEDIQSLFNPQTPFEALDIAIDEVWDAWGIDAEKRVVFDALQDPDQLKKDITNPESGSAWNDRQQNYLAIFNQLNMQSQGLSGLMSAFMFGDRNGPGGSLVEGYTHMDAIGRMANNKTWVNRMEVGGRINDDGAFIPTTEQGHAAQNSFILANNLYGDLFAYDSDAFAPMLGAARKFMGRDITPTEIRRVFKDFKSYMAAWAYNESEVLTEDLDDLRMRLLYGNDDMNDLATRVLDARRDWGANNVLLRFLDVVPPAPIEEVVGEGIQQTVRSPAEIDFRYMKMEESDELRIMQSLAEMLSSSMVEERRLGEDLILYTMMVRGWRHTPTTMADLIPPAFLKEIGIMDALDSAILNGEETSTNQQNTINQFYQHNPEYAKELRGEQVAAIPGGGRFRLPTSFTLDLQRSDRYGGLITIGEDGSVNAPSHIQYWDKPQGRRRLFAHLGDGDYVELNVLGSATKRASNIYEYNPHRGDAVSVVLPQMGVVRSRTIRENSPQKANPEIGNATTHRDAYTKYVNQNSTDLREALKRILRDSELDESVHAVAQALLSSSNVKLANTPIKRDTRNTHAGRYNRKDGVVYVNPQHHRTSEASMPALTILHEAVHAVTNQPLNLLQQINNPESDVTWDSVDLIDEVKQSLRDLNNLYRDARKMLRNELGAEQWNDAQEQIRRLSDESDEFGPADADPYVQRVYAVSSVREFASHLMSDPDFQKWAASIEAKKGKSLLDRFIEGIKDLVQAIVESTGVEVNRPTLLSRGIESVMGIAAASDAQVSIPSGSTMSAGDLISETTYNNVIIQKLKADDGVTYRVLNSKRNPLNKENQERILNNYLDQSEARDPVQDQIQEARTEPPPPANLPSFGMRSDLEGTVGDFIESLTTEQRQTFRNLRKQIRTRCD